MDQLHGVQYFFFLAGMPVIILSALLGFVNLLRAKSPFQGDVAVAPTSSAVGNIVLRLLPNSSSYEDGMSLFIGVVLYIHNAVYEHFFSSWAFFQRALIVPIALSATLFVWWWYVMFELWHSLLNLSLMYCEPQSAMMVISNPHSVRTWVNCSETVVADVSGSVLTTRNLE